MFRRESERNGFVTVFLDDGASTCLHFDDWEGINHAIDQEYEWYMGKDTYGAPKRIRISKITGIGLATPENVARYDAEEAAEEEYNKLNGS